VSQAALARVGDTCGPAGDSEDSVDKTSVVPVRREVAVAAVAMESSAASTSMLVCRRSSGVAPVGDLAEVLESFDGLAGDKLGISSESGSVGDLSLNNPES
jgi:hypothetical protein